MLVPPLPSRARLLHVGLTKTGTTALQNVASRRRRELLQLGVRYPGRHYNHRRAAFALYRRDSRSADPRPDAWDDLLAELVDDQRRRVLISNEFIAGWDDVVAARFLEQLGPRTHVVITLRSYGALLPSIWQQYVKGGHTVGFEDFLRITLTGSTDAGPPPPHLDRHDHGLVVQRWCGLAGASRVTVVVGDKARPTLIPSAFEGLLGLPTGFLHDPTQGGSGTNRSLSAEEAGLLLAVNRILVDHELSEADLVRLLRRGATARFLDECRPGGPDAALSLPPWAAEAAAARGTTFAEQIAASGVRVLGDLRELGRVPRSRPGRWTTPDAVSTEVAAQALVGALSAALGGGSNFGLPSGARPSRVPRTTRRLLRGARRIPTRVARVIRSLG